ncbi:hypothetical protein RR42_s0159 [Cupriavidus basilensis]|uniref:Uncharacterized protein n=1 Tax=Cupriavidus basilensis TaxID=68895 RepID=A0A0C4Y8L1_9BURK|nr:hypothetical protein RR42_s0159 [Cupriavidus basilensis]
MRSLRFAVLSPFERQCLCYCGMLGRAVGPNNPGKHRTPLRNGARVRALPRHDAAYTWAGMCECAKERAPHAGSRAAFG